MVAPTLLGAARLLVLFPSALPLQRLLADFATARIQPSSRQSVTFLQHASPFPVTYSQRVSALFVQRAPMFFAGASMFSWQPPGMFRMQHLSTAALQSPGTQCVTSAFVQSPWTPLVRPASRSLSSARLEASGSRLGHFSCRNDFFSAAGVTILSLLASLAFDRLRVFLESHSCLGDTDCPSPACGSQARANHLTHNMVAGAFATHNGPPATAA